MWRPRGELQESLTVAGVTSAVLLVVLKLFAPQSLHGMWPSSAPTVVERAAREDLESLVRAQSRYHARTGRYALDLSSIPWRSGFNIWVRVRDADADGYRVAARAGRRTPVDCELTVRRRADARTAGDSAAITCRPR